MAITEVTSDPLRERRIVDNIVLRSATRTRTCLSSTMSRVNGRTGVHGTARWRLEALGVPLRRESESSHLWQKAARGGAPVWFECETELQNPKKTFAA